MLLERAAWFDRRTARYLVAWWLASILCLAVFVFEFLFPVDDPMHLLSVQGIGIVGFMSAAWLVPGFLLGGWKVLLVAAGRSTIRTGTDRGWMIVFAAWAIGWPLAVVLVPLAQSA